MTSSAFVKIRALLLLRFICGVLFLFSGLLKMTDLMLFEESFIQFNIVSRYSKLVTIIVPSVEFVAGMFLVFGLFVKGSACTLSVMVLVFTLGIGKNLMDGHTFDCGCFGPLDIFSKISIEKVLFNLGLMLILLVIGVKEKRVSLYDHLKIILGFSLMAAFLLYIPFSTASWAFQIHVQDIKDIGWKEAISMMENEQAVLIDTRQAGRYEEGHVPGSLSIPYADFRKRIKQLPSGMLRKDRAIIVYCDGTECSAAERTGYKLVARGYRRVYKVGGGYDVWTSER